MVEIISSDKVTAVVGLGLTGLSYARYLERQQRPFVIMDSRRNPPMLNQLEQEFDSSRFMRALHLGGLHRDSLLNASEILVSPGYPLDDELLREAEAAGIKIHGDMSLFAEQCTGKVVAITGSNAKSTVTAWLAHMAEQAGASYGVGGNIGRPVLELLEEAPKQIYILELSSFQLEATPKLDAEVAAILNVSADHMDRYPNMMAYHRAKQKVYRGAKQVVCNRQDSLTQPLQVSDMKLLSFGLDKPDLGQFGLRFKDGEEYLACGLDCLLPSHQLSLPGRHNISNALAALALGTAAGLPMAAMLGALQNFKGLPHRCEPVAEYQQVLYINDSKGTNVGATIAALEGLGCQRKLVLIAGGVGKGADFAPLLKPIAQYCRAVVCIGADGPKLMQLLGDTNCASAKSMQQAVELASDFAEAGDAVLLSPACASFDMFANFEARGEAFAAAVATLQAGGAND
ncbi:MAG: UDP-N-acetylmuramoyl-L-alanine--D-glutamate ligase [Cellvibrionaceae bacterium]|nr:UDP-N-acetylmuramoyl-L-alanine--D-glutamate ligase [Cellvibrionaceae bacterium]